VSFIRRTSRNRLIAVVVALVAIGVASVALAAGPLSASTSTPPKKPLAQALADAAAAPAVQGVTARIAFTNNLIGSDLVPGSSPLLSGATGRLWATNDGRFRLELQGQSGDAQIVGDGTAMTVVQPGNSTVYRFVLPTKQDATGTGTAPTSDTPPTAASIQQLLDQVAGLAVVSPAEPTNVAGQPAYEVRVAPAENGGLLGAVAVAWDAARGLPLRVGIYARGATDPTLQLAVTDISYGAVAGDALDVGLPAGAKVQTVDLGQLRHERPGTPAPDGKAPETVAQVQANVGFPLKAPDHAAGLPRTAVRTVGGDGKAGALVVYGHGLGSILVLEQQAEAGAAPAGKPGGIDLPSVSIAGAPGSELSTALGSVVRVTKDGVTTTVLGSVPAAAAEAAASDVVSS